MYGKVTRENIEHATVVLQKLIPHRPLAIEWYNRKARIIGRDHSTPFGSNYHTKSELYDILWFAINALRIARDPQGIPRWEQSPTAEDRVELVLTERKENRT